MPDQCTSPRPKSSPARIVNAGQYAAMYAASVADPGAFWGEQGEGRLDQALHAR